MIQQKGMQHKVSSLVEVAATAEQFSLLQSIGGSMLGWLLTIVHPPIAGALSSLQCLRKTLINP
jgi:hypothetical protein